MIGASEMGIYTQGAKDIRGIAAGHATEDIGRTLAKEVGGVSTSHLKIRKTMKEIRPYRMATRNIHPTTTWSGKRVIAPRQRGIRKYGRGDLGQDDAGPTTEEKEHSGHCCADYGGSNTFERKGRVSHFYDFPSVNPGIQDLMKFSRKMSAVNAHDSI